MVMAEKGDAVASTSENVDLKTDGLYRNFQRQNGYPFLGISTIEIPTHPIM